MNPLLSSVEKKLLALPVRVSLVLPHGKRLGHEQPDVTFVARESLTLANMASGDVGLIGEDYVEGRCDIQGTMRNVM